MVFLSSVVGCDRPAFAVPSTSTAVNNRRMRFMCLEQHEALERPNAATASERRYLRGLHNPPPGIAAAGVRVEAPGSGHRRKTIAAPWNSTSPGTADSFKLSCRCAMPMRAWLLVILFRFVLSPRPESATSVARFQPLHLGDSERLRRASEPRIASADWRLSSPWLKTSVGLASRVAPLTLQARAVTLLPSLQRG